ncbi:hypothetical protein HZA56_17700 [Candidatus Poribacteria bacterium]|nr:hypothetical protein [Candidatus Poribacteria bacterium]
MKQVVIDNPILNSPFLEPTCHFKFSEEGITYEIVEGRRVSSYLIPIARPKKKGKSPQLTFDSDWPQDQPRENKFINRVRSESLHGPHSLDSRRQQPRRLRTLDIH